MKRSLNILNSLHGFCTFKFLHLSEICCVRGENATNGIISHHHSNPLLNAIRSGEQWGAIKGAQMAGWPRQCYCSTNDPKGVDVLFSFILPVCLPFSTQIKCSFVAVFRHRTGSAVLPQ